MANKAKAKAVPAKTKDASSEELTDAPVRKMDTMVYDKPEGSYVTTPILKIMNNPNRDSDVFVWNEEKLLGLQQTYLADGILATFEVSADKWGGIFLAGGGHHRVEAARRLIEAGKGPNVRGLFQNDNDDWCIKVVKKKYTKEQMLRMFMIENADAWSKDAQSNICMMTVQVKDALDKKLKGVETVEDFINIVNSPYPLKMDAKSFSRAKNSGAGASLIVQYLGEETWSRPAIQMALQLMYEEGEAGAKLRELAEKLPNITTAYKFKSLMVQEIDGEKVLSSAEDQEKAEKIIATQALSRADIEAADKLKKDEGLNPLEALEKVVGDKKDAVKAEKEAAKKEPAAPTPSASNAEQAVTAVKSARNFLILGKDDLSKAQFQEILDSFADIVKTIQEIKIKFGGDKKAKK